MSGSRMSTFAFSILSMLTIVLMMPSTSLAEESTPEIQWTDVFSEGNNSSSSAGIAVTKTGVTYTGGKISVNPVLEAVLQKTDADGNTEWTRAFGTGVPPGGGDGDNDEIHCVATDISGDAIVGGYVGDALPGQIHAGAADAFVRKYNASGDVVWTYQFGTSGTDRVYGLATDATGDIFAVGYTSGVLPGESSFGGGDGFLVKLSSGGIPQWTKQFGSSAWDRTTGIALDGDGNILIGGHSQGLVGSSVIGATDAFAIKFSPFGAMIWASQFGTTVYDESTGIAVDSENGVYATGWTNGIFPGEAPRGGSDSYAVKLSSSGEVVWNTQFGGSMGDFAMDIAVDSNDRIYVSGLSYGTFTKATSRNRAFIQKLYASGEHAVVIEDNGWTAGRGIAIDSSGDVYVSGYWRIAKYGTSLTDDRTPPLGSLRIEDGAVFTSNRVVNLDISELPGPSVSKSATGQDAYDMRFRNSGDEWSQWEPFNSSKPWTLPPGESVKTVEMVLRDAAGNESDAVVDSIDLAFTKVTIWPRWSSAPFGYWSKLAGTVKDGGSSPIAGATVYLQYKDGSSWRWLKTVTTGSTGYYQHWFYYEGGTRTYRAKHVGSGRYSNLTTPTFSKNITVWNNYRPKVRYCQWTKLHGKYGGPSGVYSNHTLYMQRWTGGGWTWQATVKTNNTGYYSAWAQVCPTTKFRMATAGSAVTSSSATKTGSSINAWQNTKVHASIKDGYGSGVGGMKLYLQKWNGSSWTWQATCTTSSSGYCNFGSKNPSGWIRVATGGSKVVSKGF